MKENGWEFDFWRDLLTTPRGRLVRLPTHVIDHLALENIWVAVLGRQIDRLVTENVMAFDASGKMAWQIERRPETSASDGYFYQSIDKDYQGDGLLKIRNWNHYDAYVDIDTGRIKELVDTLPGWKVDGALVSCPDKVQVKMPGEVEKYDLVLDNLLVMINPPRGYAAKNVFLVSPAGRIIWQVAPIAEIAGDGSDGYVAYSELLDDQKTLRLFAFGGTVNIIDINTGESVGTYYGK